MDFVNRSLKSKTKKQTLFVSFQQLQGKAAPIPIINSYSQEATLAAEEGWDQQHSKNVNSRPLARKDHSEHRSRCCTLPDLGATRCSGPKFGFLGDSITSHYSGLAKFMNTSTNNFYIYREPEHVQIITQLVIYIEPDFMNTGIC